MSQKNNDIIYSAADIEKYHKGMLSAKEMHALEKAALDDPFLADSLEGYAASGVNASADIAELKNRLTKRVEEEENKVVPIVSVKKTSFSWWKVAAMIVLIAGAGILIYQLSFTNKKDSIVQTDSNKKAEKDETSDSDKAASPVFLKPDTNTSSLAADQQKTGAIKSELSAQDSTAPSKETADTKTDGLINDKEVAIHAPAVSSAPTAIEAEKKEEVALTDDSYKKRAIAAKKEDFKARNLNISSDSISGAAEQKVNTVTPGIMLEKNAKARSYRALNQTNVFRGRVTDVQNNALPFSNITNTEDNIGTYSDAKGYFVLTSPDSVLNVQVSSLGFETNKVQLQRNVPSNNVSLQEDLSGLSEVVISNKKVNSKIPRNSILKSREPEPADGWDDYDLYLANNLKTPDKQADIKGEVELLFEVDKNGTPFNITIQKSLCESCDKEAIRLVKEGPKWKRKAKKEKATVKVAF